MTVGTVAQDRTVKLPVPDAAMTVDGAQGEGEGNAGLFADVLAQLIGGDAAGQGAGDDAALASDDTSPVGEEVPEASVPAVTASSLPTPPALQALLVNALSTIVKDVKSDTQLAAAVEAGTGSDLLKLAQLIAKSAQGQDGAAPASGATDAGDGKDLKGITATLEAWADGPYAVAAPATGAIEKKPMDLSVVTFETHFAPVLAAEIGVPAELKAMAATLPAEIKREAAATASKVEVPATGVDAVANVKVEVDAQSGGDGNSDAPARPKPVVPDATEATSANTAVRVPIESMQQPGQPVTAVKQIAQEIAGAVQGTPQATLQPIDGKPGLSKLKVLQIQLQPESLGTVTIKMALRADTLELHIDAARAETADLIQRDREVLSSLLRAVGYRADDAQIIVTHADPAAIAANADSGLGSSQSQGGAQAGLQSGTQSGSQAGSQAAGERSANSQGREGGDGRRGHGQGDGSSRERDPQPGRRSDAAAGIYL